MRRRLKPKAETRVLGHELYWRVMTTLPAVRKLSVLQSHQKAAPVFFYRKVSGESSLRTDCVAPFSLAVLIPKIRFID